MAAKPDKVKLADRIDDLGIKADLLHLAIMGEASLGSGDEDTALPLTCCAREIAAALHDLAREVALA